MVADILDSVCSLHGIRAVIGLHAAPGGTANVLLRGEKVEDKQLYVLNMLTNIGALIHVNITIKIKK